VSKSGSIPKKPQCEVIKLFNKIDTKVEQQGSSKLTDLEWDWWQMRLIAGMTGRLPKWAVNKYVDPNDVDYMVELLQDLY